MTQRKEQQRIEVSHQGRVVVLRLSAQFEHDLRERSCLTKTVAELVSGGERHFVLDLLRLPYLESAIRDIIVCNLRIRKSGGVMAIAVRANNWPWLEAMQLNRVFGVADTVDSAVEKCQA